MTKKGLIVRLIVWPVVAWFVASIIFMWPPVVNRGRPKAATSACLKNLRIINSAKEQWAAATGMTNGTEVVIAEVNRYIKGGKTPLCPDHGTYTYGVIGVLPTCSLGDVEPRRVRRSLFTWDWSPSRGHRLPTTQ